VYSIQGREQLVLLVLFESVVINCVSKERGMMDKNVSGVHKQRYDCWLVVINWVLVSMDVEGSVEGTRIDCRLASTRRRKQAA
jgi:hypothetical protein